MGETLRGTLSTAVDKRFPVKNEEKAAVTNARNEEILQKGRAEMEGIPGSWPGHEQYHEPEPTAYHETTAPVVEPPRTVSPPEKEKKGLGKLFKRKPVSISEQGTGTR